MQPNMVAIRFSWLAPVIGCLALVACQSAAPWSKTAPSDRPGSADRGPDDEDRDAGGPGGQSADLAPTPPPPLPSPPTPPPPTPPPQGCPAAPLAAGKYLRHVQSGGLNRAFYLRVPPGYTNQPTPVVLAFHGGGHTATGFEAFLHLMPKAEAAGFIAVWPEGTGVLGLNSWNSGACCPTATMGAVDDVAFTRALLDELEKLVCVDRRRVYATGFSNGAMQAHRLACELSDRIAAIAPVAGGLGAKNVAAPGSPYFTCAPARHVPLLEIHGTKDACYPWAGGASPLVPSVTFTGVDETIAGWVARNGCSTATTVTFQQGTTVCRRYQCPADGTVELCRVEGGGHYWPGADDWPGSKVLCGGQQGALTNDLKAVDAIWQFFVDHPMP